MLRIECFQAYLDIPSHVEVVFQPRCLGSRSRRFTLAPEFFPTFHELLLHGIPYCKDFNGDGASLACPMRTLGADCISQRRSLEY